MLDETTRAECQRLEELATRNGWDLYETLERGGLLLSRDRRILVERAVLAALTVQLEDMQPGQFPTLVNGNQTVRGAVDGVIRFVELYAKALQ